MCWAQTAQTTGPAKCAAVHASHTALVAQGWHALLAIALRLAQAPSVDGARSALPALHCTALQGLEKFLNAASSDPDTVLHYEFMQASHHPAAHALPLQLRLLCYRHIICTLLAPHFAALPGFAALPCPTTSTGLQSPHQAHRWQLREDSLLLPAR